LFCGIQADRNALIVVNGLTTGQIAKKNEAATAEAQRIGPR